MNYLIYDEKRKQWGSVLKKQKLEGKTYYQINYDNELKPEDESKVNFYTEDLKKVLFEFCIYYSKIGELASLDVFYGGSLYLSPKEAVAGLKVCVEDLKKQGYSIEKTEISTVDIDTII